MMSSTSILLPPMVLVGWTFLVLLLIPYQRFKAAHAKLVVIDDFKLGESANVPAHVSLPNRNFMNLLEMPVLFYVVSFTLLLSQQVDALAVNMAWAYVGLRMGHSLVHLTYNNVMHRLGFFVASNIVLVMVWSRLLWALT
jgi:hypothetical protein